MARILGLVNLHCSPDLGQINKVRSLATLPFLGRYAFVDFPLSNFSNSNINTVGILVNKSPRSMIKHMNNAMSYTNNTKMGKTVICYNENFANSPLYNTDINNIIENKWLYEDGKFKYVVISPAHMIYRLDFNEVIEDHIKNNASITCVYKKINNGKTAFIDQDVFEFNKDGTLSEINKNLGVEDEVNVSMETYVISIDKLKDLLDFSTKTSKLFTLRDVINYLCSTVKVNTFEYHGFLETVRSLSDYLNISLRLLNIDKLKELCSTSWPIYTNTHDTPPAKYLEHSKVTNSFVTNGAIIDGKVDTSVVCRDAVISKGATVRNSIILSNAFISENCILENVIVDKGAKIINVKELKGTKDNPLYVGQGDVI